MNLFTDRANREARGASHYPWVTTVLRPSVWPQFEFNQLAKFDSVNVARKFYLKELN